MKIFRVRTIVFVCLWAVAVPAWGQGFEDRVIEHRFANGLTLLMVKRTIAPVVSCNITFRVGGADERTGETGVAHLFEHMAFKGSERIGTWDFAEERSRLAEVDEAWEALREERTRGNGANPETLEALERKFREAQEAAGKYVVGNEIATLYGRHGGVGLNASTGKELTRYVVSLPANRLELWAAIESDRLRNPVLREFYKERDVVLEERRLRYENSPRGMLYEAFLATAFWAHPFGMPVIGWSSDIGNLSRTATEEFYRAYYIPNNAVISIVGDIDPEATIALIDRYFGSLAPGRLPTRTPPTEPKQVGERRVEIEYRAEPSVIIGYHKPELVHPDDPVFDVINAILTEGRSSRLYRSLVKEKRIAVGVSSSTGVPGVRYPNLFVIQSTPRAPHSTRDIEEAVETELERLGAELVSKEELEKVLIQLDAELIRSLRSNSGMASLLSYFQSTAGRWRYILDNRDGVSRVTPEDVRRVASRYFSKSNRVVATLVLPSGRGDEAGEP